MSLIQLVLSVILYFVIFFGISFIVNMLLRMTWFMSVLYPIFVFLMVDNISTVEYFKNPGDAFSTALSNVVKIGTGDIVVLSSGFAGTIVSGLVMKALRKSGYQMF